MILRLVFLLPGCTGADPVDTAAAVCDEEPHVTWANWGDGFFSNYCRACHSVSTPDRYDAPEGVDFDTLEDVGVWAGRIRTRVLEEETMPVGGGVFDEDLAMLDRFLVCNF